MTVRDRYEGIQSILGRCYNGGCHFLSLCTIVEEENHIELDLINTIRISMSKGWFKSDFTGTDAIAFLEYFTGKCWSRTTVKRLPLIKTNQYTEAIYYNPRTGCHHYRRRGFDVLEDSVTVREGYIEAYHVYTCK